TVPPPPPFDALPTTIARLIDQTRRRNTRRWWRAPNSTIASLASSLQSRPARSTAYDPRSLRTSRSLQRRQIPRRSPVLRQLLERVGEPKQCRLTPGGADEGDPH